MNQCLCWMREAECRSCLVSQSIPLYWMPLCWMYSTHIRNDIQPNAFSLSIQSLCLVPLCWVSHFHIVMCVYVYVCVCVCVCVCVRLWVGVFMCVFLHLMSAIKTRYNSQTQKAFDWNDMKHVQHFSRLKVKKSIFICLHCWLQCGATTFNIMTKLIRLISDDTQHNITHP